MLLLLSLLSFLSLLLFAPISRVFMINMIIMIMGFSDPRSGQFVHYGSRCASVPGTGPDAAGEVAPGRGGRRDPAPFFLQFGVGARGPHVYR